MREIAGLRPSFMSVTYGAGGSNSRNTLSVAEEVQKNGVTALAHLTCVGQDRASLRASIEQFRASGMENSLELREACRVRARHKRVRKRATGA